MNALVQTRDAQNESMRLHCSFTYVSTKVNNQFQPIKAVVQYVGTVWAARFKWRGKTSFPAETKRSHQTCH